MTTLDSALYKIRSALETGSKVTEGWCHDETVLEARHAYQEAIKLIDAILAARPDKWTILTRGNSVRDFEKITRPEEKND